MVRCPALLLVPASTHGVSLFFTYQTYRPSWSTEHWAVFQSPVFISKSCYSNPSAKLVQECPGSGGEAANVLWSIWHIQPQLSFPGNRGHSTRTQASTTRQRHQSETSISFPEAKVPKQVGLLSLVLIVLFSWYWYGSVSESNPFSSDLEQRSEPSTGKKNPHHCILQ